ncbi:hypothetical protein K431DRAFT_286240 [Polychaeton citri CBS 116435]|uniref:Vacuolar ATPase assembly integral membrane protein VMA21 n=1 Tax=Polychaeton citri CBS 116435 TaxID=1314669 RepID=A0A9P4Q7M3_9PEZI|nr:hypothetical protein K431DRAFT_286240 [Polychaeton citri CBS 116435]
MATRRGESQEKAQDGFSSPPSSSTKSDITPAVAPNVIAKLLGFTFAMITFPISSYFLSRDYLFKGNATWAGGFAALVANVVLLSYCVIAFQDDKTERELDEAERKKTR